MPMELAAGFDRLRISFSEICTRLQVCIVSFKGIFAASMLSCRLHLLTSSCLPHSRRAASIAGSLESSVVACNGVSVSPSLIFWRKQETYISA